MEDSIKKKLPTLFWVVAAAATLWNLAGVAAYLGDAFMTPEMLQAMPEEQQSLYTDRPAWVVAAFAIGVWFGLLGSVGLLLRKKWAYLMFVISLVGVLAQNVHSFFLSNTFEVVGNSAMVFPLLIIIISVFLMIYSKKAKENGWLG